MIVYRQGDLFKSHAQVIVIPVNCVGAMGRGLALQIREKSPKLYRDYRKLCAEGLQPGGVQAMRERLDFEVWDESCELPDVSLEPRIVGGSGLETEDMSRELWTRASRCESWVESCEMFDWGCELLASSWEFPAVDDSSAKPRDPGPQVWLFATKDHFKDPSRTEWIRSGLQRLRQLAEIRGVQWIGLPALGCGYGGLRWPDVRGHIEEIFGGYDGTAGFILEVFEPSPNGPARRRGFRGPRFKLSK
jgi:O-acetyl-ADP-ribose deacetylase (regulator of RNase III)